MVKVEPYDGFRVSCDCGQTFDVGNTETDSVQCPNDDCTEVFSIDVSTEKEVVSFGRMPM